MIEILKSRIANYQTQTEKYHYLREYFQLLILKILDEKGAYKNIAFMGGTALRIIYDLPRFSEDLDFTVTKANDFDLTELSNILMQELKRLGLNVSISAKTQNAVAIANIKIAEILFELGISPLKDQKIMIKFEVDQNPPADFETEMTLINKEFLFSVKHLDIPSLCAGKLMAFFCRKYTKGRDYYDMMWFFTKNHPVNLNYLNAGLAQATQNPIRDIDDLKQKLIEKIKASNFKQVLQDVSTFLEKPEEARFFTNEIFISLIQKWTPSQT